MKNDPKITLLHRQELAAVIRQAQHDEAGRLIRLTARQDIAREVINAQAAITAAEDAVFRNLPTPPPDDVKELATKHPVVAGRRHQLERLEGVFGPMRMDQAEQLAKAVAGEGCDPTPATSSKPGRRPKQSGTEGGTP